MSVYRSVFIIVFAMLSVVPASAQVVDGSSSPITDAFLARDDGKGNAGEMTRSFRPGDIPIHCVVSLKGDRPMTVKLAFYAVDVKGVRPGTRVVTASFTTTKGQDQVFFTGKPHDKWSPGKYRVDLSVDDKVERELEFEVTAATVTTKALPFNKPASNKKPRRP